MKGFYRKYIISKVDGTPIDPNAEYFVLRLDSGEYVDACRKGAVAFAEAVQDQNPLLSNELLDFVTALESEEAAPLEGNDESK